MTRKDAIEKFMANVKDSDIVVSSTGMVSRDLYAVKDRDLNFYMQGSMGNALSIGLGLALNTERFVYVLNGDGSALMNLGSLVTCEKLQPKNLLHIILDNNAHNSTGGQPTASDYVDFENIYKNTIVVSVENTPSDSGRIPLSCEEIKNRFMEAIKNTEE